MKNRFEAIFLEKGSGGIEEIRPLEDRIQALKSEIDTAFPMNDTEITELFEQMQQLLAKIFDKEKKAVETLAAAL